MSRSGLIAKSSDKIRRKIARENRSPDSEVLDDIADKRVVHRVLEPDLGQSATDQRRATLRATVANHSVLSWEPINRLREYGFSDEKRRDAVRIPPRKKHLEIPSSNRGKESRVNSVSQSFSGRDYIALRTFASRNP
jgi:hypothetical protein